MAPRKCHFFADLCTLGVLFSFVVIGLYYSVKNANENYGAGVYVPYILPRDESHYNDVRDFLIANNVSSQLVRSIFTINVESIITFSFMRLFVGT